MPPAWLLLRTRYVPRRGVRACMCARALCVVISRVNVLSLLCAAHADTVGADVMRGAGAGNRPWWRIAAASAVAAPAAG